MEKGVRYIVTKDSVNGEMQVGDHIYLADNGDLINIEAQGWMPKDDIEEATEGMEYEIDENWFEKRKLALQQELEKIKGFLNE